jgi:futalosine hydrolase
VRILVVAATAAEVAPLVARLRYVADGPARLTSYTGAGHDVDLLVSGVGMVATASWTSARLARASYDLALNLGVCGSFNPSLSPGGVVHVVSDRLIEMGAEDGDAFLSVHEMHLVDEDDFPFTCGRLENLSPPRNAVLSGLPSVHGITVNTVHGNEASIARVVGRVGPDVESMEGAAFMYVCLTHGVPFAQVRAVSNFVERRNRAAWKLEEAIATLGSTAWRMLES